MKHRLCIVGQKIFCMIAGGLLFIGAAFAIYSMALRLQGTEIVTVQTGSMVPTFSPGDALLVEKRAPRDVKPGQVISYRSLKDSKVIVSHRLVSVNHAGELIAQGDALDSADPAFSADRLVGRASAVLPGFGRILSLIHSPIGLLTTIYIPASVLIYRQLHSVLDKHRAMSYSAVRDRQATETIRM
jgi:signal peptidase I